MSADRRPNGTFVKGASGNPGGRSRGLVAIIHELTENGRTYTETMVKISKGEPVFGLELTTKDVREACAWLADREYGKATQSVEHTGAEGQPLSISIDLGAGK
jgi:hypothetical protein